MQTTAQDKQTAGAPKPRRLYVYNGGFLTQSRIRRILTLSGYDIKLGKPGPDDLVGVWGQSPTSPRGEAVARATGNPVLRIEDAFLRSVQTGREGNPPLGLTLDQTGVHFDGRQPSDLETLLAKHPLDDTQLLNRARDGIAMLRHLHLSKYNAFDPDAEVPEAPYVLVIDQTRGDASVTASGADKAAFRDMLITAMVEHPGNRIVIKTHPETAMGHRAGHFDDSDSNERVSLNSDALSPWALMEGAVAVYTMSSQLGFEAILAGHRPVVFGQPFYGGWGLTDDRNPVARRSRRLTRAQLFAGAMLLYPKWYDPYTDCLCDFETVARTLHSQARAWREDHRGWTAMGMRLWKRAPLKRFFGSVGTLRFQDDYTKACAASAADGSQLMIWAGKADKITPSPPASLYRIEDGFLRSKGLGATLVPPMSLVLDDLGIYYDPRSESRLERLINDSPKLPDVALSRAEALRHTILRAGLSKYNLDAETAVPLPIGHRILVPGQVEDDASIKTGCAEICSNLQLLRATRAANPLAIIIYKPHPDVEAGLRLGTIPPEEAARHADVMADNTDPIELLKQVNEVWTMTSLLGFEALLRDIPVTCFGMPFYAGWGLTQDQYPDLHGGRRQSGISLNGLTHAALIDYPRYFDPRTAQACPPETVVERLRTDQFAKPGPALRLLSKIQGVFASATPFWR